MHALTASLRIALATLVVCVAGYALAVFGLARAISPASAEGSLVALPGGRIVGSRLIAQRFAEPRYFWPRPSAVDYNAAAAGGSNKSPTSPDLEKRATATVARYGATPARPLPADLAAASGSGLDPDITVRAARYQAARVSRARGLPPGRVESLIDQHAYSPGGPLTPDRLVKVLELNLALDRSSAGG